jgi:membrane protein implicated in regulation of membrane protease activity
MLPEQKEITMGTIEFWYWWVAGIALIVLEALVPGAFFLWMGVSAGVVGLILWLAPAMSWEWQLLLFAVFSVTSIVLWRLRQRKHPTHSEDENLNQRTKQYLDRIFTLTEPIVDGIGKIQVDDSQWRIAGPDCDAGVKVKVVSANGVTLIVEPLTTSVE